MGVAVSTVPVALVVVMVGVEVVVGGRIIMRGVPGNEELAREEDEEDGGGGVA